MDKEKEDQQKKKEANKHSLQTEDLKSPEELEKQARLTKEDREALGPKDLSMDMGDDEQLKHRKNPVDFGGQDLDIPGRGLDDAQEEIGSEDEENNHYSLGSDAGDELEEDKS